MALPRMRMSEPAHATAGLGAVPGVEWPSERVRMGAALAGLAAAALVVAHFGAGARALVGVVLVAALALLAVTDIERRTLPNLIVLPAFAIVLALQLILFPERAHEWILASLGAGLILLIAALAKPGGLGYGDVKLGLLLGAGLGEDVVLCLVIAGFAMWPVAVHLYIRHGRAAGRMSLPFEPFLAVGAVVALLA